MAVHGPAMNSSDRLVQKFAEALRGDFGPRRLSHAVRSVMDGVVAARADGASWQQIAERLNLALNECGRSKINADSLRGMVGREARKTLVSSVQGPALREMSSASASPATVANAAPTKLAPGKIMPGDLAGGSNVRQSSILRAARKALSTHENIRRIENG
ncbi:hypothetical protein [Devosia pacifica]|uniref:hypothetical protein n=1 Tax=Devosia pacifica TaxID=1335967 RepID=UPI001673D320|nr:hypothetical protein [Devosia pacifica]